MLDDDERRKGKGARAVCFVSKTREGKSESVTYVIVEVSHEKHESVALALLRRKDTRTHSRSGGVS